MKIISLLHVLSASRGKISIQDFLLKIDEVQVTDSSDVAAVVTQFLPALDLCDDSVLSQSETKPLVFKLATLVRRYQISCHVACVEMR